MKLKIVATGLLAMSAAMACAQNINGAGATFPYPIYSKWFTEYNQLHPEVKINYQSIGSGGGIRQVTEGTVDFGASDAVMTDQQIAEAKVKVMAIPTVLGAVVPVYSLPGVNQEIKFSQDAIAGIYLGKITKWNDPYIAKENPGVNLPDKQILPVYRSDGSGTTYIFTDYLAKISPEWLQKVGRAASVKWPVGIGQKGNEGVAGMVRQLPYSFGYVELIYAETNHMQFGLVRNAAGKFVKASTSGVTAAAAANAKNIPADYRVSITNAPGADSYPISSFTWLLIPVQSKDAAKGKALQGFLNWMLEKGEGEAAAMTYAPLPKAVADRVHQTIMSVK
ncbi:phosphate ABC transporter substrate-binding protein PstS [Granulicella tundricola]|uniref:Phosphate-binding protein n=1 Tax=Granulicella tundricola (strain ATCC BAA-1859 / DSM 23138 / MP5ACTX9) TaxID=1198114 RepID=E8WYS0_GRATM|nr:phosphate ABC transporter substrate-binding protein PstS [Granulicella tundricola]ADW68756.1 phosphate ABC transporter, periplasmic phosphate-binding protein [Granulicella tundricola MP5ACTX9]